MEANITVGRCRGATTARRLFSVIIPTYNRADVVSRAIESVLRQCTDEVRFEIIVVDNNSQDATAAVVRDYVKAARDCEVRYLFEPRPGVSYARNLGIEHAQADLIVFLDDDLEATPGWLQRFKQAFEEHPEIDCIGGYVRPRWAHTPPPWLTAAEFAGPISGRLGSKPVPVDREHAAQCLGAGNLACRRRVFEQVGRFSPHFLRGQDREFELRLWRAGKRGLYLPDIEVIAEVEPERMTRRHHRRWYAQTGKSHAQVWYRDLVNREGVLMDKPRGRSLLGTPLFIYRELLSHVVGSIVSALRGESDRRFFHETRLWYDIGFVCARFRQDRERYPPPE